VAVLEEKHGTLGIPEQKRMIDVCGEARTAL
jgi:hypothetical protein